MGMTLREAGKLYEKREREIEQWKENAAEFFQSIRECDGRGVCGIRKETAEIIYGHLVEYIRRLETELDLNI